MVVEGQSQSCGVCRGAAEKRCGGCHVVYYCSRGHQRLDWLRHKPLCKPFQVCEDKVLGRHLVATRDIKAGEVVLREAPLLRGPSQVTGPVCLGCLQGISQHNSEPCGQCGWPLCLKPSCRQASQHLPECRWTVEKRKCSVKISQFVSPHPTYELVTALRLCYARRHNPGLWTKLSTLQTHTDLRRDTQKYKDDTRSIAQFLRKFYKLEDEFADDEIMDIWGIIQVNGHEVPVTHPQHVAVYEVSSMVEHSCHPNCAKSFTGAGALVLRAVAPVPRGSHLTICYTDCLWGTVNRQYHLQDTKFFSCSCSRCQDPTELGTFFSALLCDQNNCGGTVLPASLRCVTETTTWNCDRCDHCLPDSGVEDILHLAGQQLSMLADQDVSVSLDYLDRWRARFHQNHYYLTEVRLALSHRLGSQVEVLPDSLLQFKADLCRQLLKLLTVIAPAEVRVLGSLNFELHACLADRARRDHLQGEGSTVPSTLQESRRCLEEAIFFLDQEPEELPEGKLLRQAKLNKEELDKTMQTIINYAGGIPMM